MGNGDSSDVPDTVGLFYQLIGLQIKLSAELASLMGWDLGPSLFDNHSLLVELANKMKTVRDWWVAKM